MYILRAGPLLIWAVKSLSQRLAVLGISAKSARGRQPLRTLPQNLFYIPLAMQNCHYFQGHPHPVYDHELISTKEQNRQVGEVGTRVALAMHPGQRFKPVIKLGFDPVSSSDAGFTSQISPNLEEVLLRLRRDDIPAHGFRSFSANHEAFFSWRRARDSSPGIPSPRSS